MLRRYKQVKKTGRLIAGGFIGGAMQGMGLPNVPGQSYEVTREDVAMASPPGSVIIEDLGSEMSAELRAIAGPNLNEPVARPRDRGRLIKSILGPRKRGFGEFESGRVGKQVKFINSFEDPDHQAVWNNINNAATKHGLIKADQEYRDRMTLADRLRNESVLTGSPETGWIMPSRRYPRDKQRDIPSVLGTRKRGDDGRGSTKRSIRSRDLTLMDIKRQIDAGGRSLPDPSKPDMTLMEIKRQIDAVDAWLYADTSDIVDYSSHPQGWA